MNYYPLMRGLSSAVRYFNGHTSYLLYRKGSLLYRPPIFSPLMDGGGGCGGGRSQLPSLSPFLAS